YGGLLREKVRKARIVLGGFVPAIFCPNLTVAMFVFASYRRIAVCLNCLNVFLLDLPLVDGSSSEKYCSAACGGRYRQKTYRVRVSTSKKRKGKRWPSTKGARSIGSISSKTESATKRARGKGTAKLPSRSKRPSKRRSQKTR